MGVRVEWDNPDKTVIRYDFEGIWSWDEFRAATEEAFALTRSVEHRVDSISNFLRSATLPPNAFLQFRRAMANAPANRGMTIIVGGGTFIKAMVGVFSKVYRALGERLAVMDTLEEARIRLSERRQALEQTAQDAT